MNNKDKYADQPRNSRTKHFALNELILIFRWILKASERSEVTNMKHFKEIIDFVLNF